MPASTTPPCRRTPKCWPTSTATPTSSSPAWAIEAAAASGSLHDGITLERQGIPAATIITAVFASTARAYTRLMGVPDFPT